ncbi:MAG: hypothetical protein ACREH8_08725 [Opitutaceae bacterium]
MKTIARIIPIALLACFSHPMPGQTSHPIAAGSTVTLEAFADETTPMTFEWFRAGVKVADGPQLVIVSLTAADAVTYTVKATNAFGSATSEPYEITIGVEPSVPTIRVAAKKPSTVTVHVPVGTRVIYAKSP